MKVLFVCLGNICRSPAAEGVFIDLINKRGISKDFEVDSAGTSGLHARERADARMRDHALKRGIELPSLSRQFLANDFENFDWIVVMDDSNYKNCERLISHDHQRSKLLKMADFTPSFSEIEVPDPHYGGADGFERVLDMVEEGCVNLLEKIHA